MRKKRWLIWILAAALAAGMAVPAYADDDDDEEDPEPVGEIVLSFSSDIEAGDEGGDVDVTLESENCSIDEVEVTNDKGWWSGGDEPKVKVTLNADDGYYFDKGGRSAFDFSGEDVKYKSSTRKEDKEIMVLTVTLGELDEGDLGMGELDWDEEYGIAQWEENYQAASYRVRLYRNDVAVGSVHTTSQTSWDFSNQIDRIGSYSFRVRAFDRGDNAGDWEESYEMDVAEEDLVRFVGTWRSDDTGWWYENPDGSYPVNGWREVQGKWYFFGADGYMKTGWIDWEGKQYYCDPTGAMLVSTTTPDGIQVGADGARVG